MLGIPQSVEFNNPIAIFLPTRAGVIILLSGRRNSERSALGGTRPRATQLDEKNRSEKRPVSDRKVEANRQNARLSTGPRTELGKRTVARNAIKHGFLAREVVITAGDGKESLEEFDDLLGQLCEDYEPVGVIEESLVQTIATCLWRRARVIRAENGEIRKRLDTLSVDRAQRNSYKSNFDLVVSQILLANPADGRKLTEYGSSTIQEAQRDLTKHHNGLSLMTELLEDAKSEIARVSRAE